MTRESDEARRANQRKNKSGCEECGGHIWLPSGWLAHSPTCKRGQDDEAKALRHLGAGFWPSRGWALSDVVKQGEDWSRRKS